MINIAEWIAGVSLKVTPEQLRIKSNSINSKIRQMDREFNSLENRVNSTKSYWQGEANESFVEMYQEFKPEIEEILSRLREHVTDLNTMAAQYDTTEKEIQDIIEDLPSDVII